MPAASAQAPFAELFEAPKPRLVRTTPAVSALPSAALYGVRELTQGTLAVVEGAPGGWVNTAIGTGVRAGLIGLGMYLTGTRDWKQLLGGALAASGIITVVLFAGHAVVSRK